MTKRTAKTKRPSMKDVADLAGVSSTTVSFVINQSPHSNIPSETQERVWAAVRELNYRPNVMARGLRVQQTHTIGFISDEVATTPFAGRMLQGAQDLAWEHNYLLLLINTGGNQAMKEAAVEMLLDRQVDGIIYAAMYHREVHPPKAVLEVPTVLLDCYTNDAALPSVVPDEVRGGHDATKHLIDRGHSRIAFLNNLDPVPATLGRLEGYRNALDEAGIAFDPQLVKTGPIPDVGITGTLDLMQLSDPPTALFCYNDQTASEAYKVLSDLNLAIPGDVAVVGFDDLSVLAPALRPSLTTMRLPHLEMGHWAVRHLLDMMADSTGDQSPVRAHCVCPLVGRDSA